MTNLFKEACIGAAALGLASTVVGTANAQDAGFYVSVGVGQSNADIDTSSAAGLGITGLGVDDSDTTWKVNAGYQFTQNWGAEIGYVDLGKFSINGLALGVPFTAEEKLKAWTVAGVGTIPLGSSNFSIFGKLGWYFSDSSGSGRVGGTSFSVGDSGDDLFGGLGVRYDFTKNLGVQLEVEYYDGDDTVTSYTIGLRYKF